MKKKLILFCDGTWNQLSDTPTNVAKLFAATQQDAEDGTPQIVHYIAGVGTRSWIERWIGGTFGWGISQNIKEGYRFLCGNYEPGDDIYLFGFSRGAFCVRSLSGLIYNVGLLKRAHICHIDEAYAGYKNKAPAWHPNPEKGSAAKAFRERYAHGGESIRFLGVWDTVGALGAPYGLVMGWIMDRLFGCRFHDTKLSRIIVSASHALARDEHRWPFRPTLWILDERLAADRFHVMWFPGVHSDVGGGYTEPGLSDQALHWMAQEAAAQGLKIGPVVQAGEQVPHDSQRWYYRVMTCLWVKLPAAILIDVPAQWFPKWPTCVFKLLRCLHLVSEARMAAKVRRISWRGDYQRNERAR